MKVAFVQQSEDYPDYIINGVNESIKEADAGLLTPYTDLKDMLG